MSSQPSEPSQSDGLTLERRAERLLGKVAGWPLLGKLTAWILLFPLLVSAAILVTDPSKGGRVTAAVGGIFSLIAGLIVVFGPGAGSGEADTEPASSASPEPASSSPAPAETVTVEASPLPAETVTAQASPLPAETVTIEATPLPAETVTVEAEPLPAETVTEVVTEVETEYVEIQSAPDPDSGGADCHPAYDPCVPGGPDLDCADVNGPIQVDHSQGDPHGLDGDGDGVGCES